MLAVGWYARKGHETWTRGKNVNSTEKKQQLNTGLSSSAFSSNENKMKWTACVRSETLHPSAYAALQGQLEEDIAKLQAELNSLTAVADKPGQTAGETVRFVSAGGCQRVVLSW